jgi:enoyl-CoA hydratase/carnithine racemase
VTYQTFDFDTDDAHVGTITLDRTDRLNAFNTQMCEEFSHLWDRVRHDDDIHAIVLRAAGDRAFCTGDDVKDPTAEAVNPLSRVDPGAALSPKQNRVWKPLICAIHGMCAGGAFYWVNEADIVICSDDATFFDPHVTFGWPPILEPIGMSRRINLGDVLRIALMGNDERVGANRALTIGLVTEITERDQLWPRAHEIAATIAAKPPAAIQACVKAVWDSLDVGRNAALASGMQYVFEGTLVAKEQMGDEPPPPKAPWKLR